jgi:hypothetical protein
MAEHEHNPNSRQGGYERTDADLRGIVVAGIGLAIFTLLVMAICITMFNYYTARTGGNEGVIPPLPIADRGKLPPAPVLEGLERGREIQWSPETDLPPHDYAWVDEKQQIVRIPVEKAMQLALKRLKGAAPPAAGENAELAAERTQPPSAASSGRIVAPTTK